MVKKNNVPKIRFKGFTEEWEQKELGELVTYYASNLSLKDAKVNGKYKLYDANNMVGKTNEKPINEDYISVIKDGAGVGRIRMLPKNTLIISTMGALIAKNSNLRFIYTLLQRFGISENFSGSTIPHIYFKDYGKISYYIGKSEEQIKIGNFFSTLDNLITLHQRKYDKYKNLKNALLEKMFPKKGEKIPKIRFKGFTENWEQRRFEDELQIVTDYVAAGSFADLAENVKYLNFPNYAQLVRTMDLKSNFTNKEQIFVDKKAFDFLWRVNLNRESIILPNIGNCGEIYLINKEKLKYKNNVLGPNAILVRSITNNNKFLSYSFQTKMFQNNLKLIISPNGQTKFNKTDLKTVKIIIPKTLEQVKIGNLLNNIDNLITLHQDIFEKLKNIKKALLEKMFI